MLLFWAPHSKAVKNDTCHITKNKIYLVSPRGILFPMKFSKQILTFVKKAHKTRKDGWSSESAETVIAQFISESKSLQEWEMFIFSRDHVSIKHKEPSVVGAMVPEQRPPTSWAPGTHNSLQLQGWLNTNKSKIGADVAAPGDPQFRSFPYTDTGAVTTARDRCGCPLTSCRLPALDMGTLWGDSEPPLGPLPTARLDSGWQGVL